jgi:hypothetical protein
MTDEKLQAQLNAVSLLARAICSTLDNEIAKLGFPQGKVVIAAHTEAEYRLDRDPASGQDSLVGVWRNAQGHKCGELLFHADGSFFAEYDVIKVHPRKPRWFVEAVTAWGRGSLIRAEPRLLPVVG